MSVPIARAAIATTNSFSVAASTNDPSGVSWSVAPAPGTPGSNAGTFNPATTANGANVTYTPKGPGTFTVTATSVTNQTTSAAFTLYVSDLAGVYTYHNDVSRDGANTQEYALTPQNVQNHFGKLFSCQTDGAIYAQPLWVAGVTVNGAPHNVVYVATEHDSLYAFDADASPCQKLWSVSLIDTAHGGNAGETSVPDTAAGISPPAGTPPKGAPTPLSPLVGGSQASGDQAPEVGVTGTPVIDPASGTLYVVSKSVLCSPSPCTSTGNNKFYQRLHAIDITTGNEKASSPATIQAVYQVTAGGTTYTDTFDPQAQNQRPGLALANGTVYIAWSSHEDYGHYYGWVMGYNAATLQQTYVLNVAPKVDSTVPPLGGAGIWMGGGAPAADANGYVYLLTGNSTFDATSSCLNQSPSACDYGDSVLKLAAGGSALTVADFFAPQDEAADAQGDADFGSGGAELVVNLPPGSPVSQLLIGGGEGSSASTPSYLYVLNPAKLGGLESSSNPPWQKIPVSKPLDQDNGGVIYSTPAFWNNTLYLGPAAGQPLDAYQLDSSTGMFNTTPMQSTSPQGGYGFPGSTPSISASGSTNGIVWTLDNSQYCLPEDTDANNNEICGAAILHAYDAANFTNGKINELWNSSTVASDAAGHAIKFTVPTVANGKVYVGTQGTNIGWVDPSTVAGELDVYGVKPN